MNNFELNLETNEENSLANQRNKNNKNQSSEKQNQNIINEYKNHDIRKKRFLKKNRKHFNNSNVNEASKSSQRVINISNTSDKYENYLIINNRKKGKNIFDEKNENNIFKDNKNNLAEDNNERINKIKEKIPESQRYQYFIDNELNSLEYEYAINIDFRSFFQYYWALLKQMHLILFTFVSRNDYNLFLSKLALFLMSFSFNITLNTLFFTDDTMHKFYVDYGKFDFIYNLPQTIYSILISSFFTFLFELLALSDENISNFKEKEKLENIEIKKKKEIKYLKIKSIIFLIAGLIILLFFWYYVSCFCAVYSNTQIHLIKDTFISFGTGMLYPFVLVLIPTIIRIPSLRKRNPFLYKLSRILTFAISLI